MPKKSLDSITGFLGRSAGLRALSRLVDAVMPSDANPWASPDSPDGLLSPLSLLQTGPG